MNDRVTTPPEFHLFLPQMRMHPQGLIDRALSAEEAGFAGVALIDHLAPPRAEDQPMFEAMTTATWLASCTRKLKIGHLVLCDSFRHPAVLARQAVTLDHFSGGRYELAIGSGSAPKELKTFGVSMADGAERTTRLRETLEVIKLLWSGEEVSFQGRHFTMTNARQLPTPKGHIPVVVGGMGPATLKIVRDLATWWNVPVSQISRLEQCRSLVGSARISIHQLVTFLPKGADHQEILATAERRFGWVNQTGRVTGSGQELVAQFNDHRRNGVERFYVWFTDFADPDTLRAFGSEVIAEVS